MTFKTNTSLSNLNRDNIESDFLHIYEYWNRKLYSFVYLKVKRADLTQDIVQQTFMKVWERRDLFNENIKFSSQLFQIARTTLIDELRRLAQARKYVTYEKRFVATQYIDMERQLVFKNQLEYLKQLIQQMPLMRQRVFMMHKIEELTHKEIAAKLAISTKTVENHITLAFKFLKKNKSIA